jgi:dipeptidyl aminopeptidase/acylaminoacyl peptidase
MTPGIYGNAFGRLAQWMSERNAVYLCPEYRGNSWMSPAAEEDVREIFRIASDRFQPSRSLLVGGSMGGTSALIFAALNPGIVDGILAFCPATDMVTMYSKFPGHFVESYGGTPDEKPDVYHERSVRFHATNFALQRLAILHGTDDATMPVQDVRDLVAVLHASHAPVRYSEIKGGNHDAPLFDDFIPHLDWLVAGQPAVNCVSA